MENENAEFNELFRVLKKRRIYLKVSLKLRRVRLSMNEHDECHAVIENEDLNDEYPESAPCLIIM